MIRASQIDGAEYFVIGHAFDHLVYARQWVGIEVSVAIDRLRIIDNHSFLMVLVGGHQYLRAPWRIARFYNTFFQ